MGDHLRRAGMGCRLVGNTHMAADAEGMARLGLDPDSIIGARVAECGFDVFERDDGMRAVCPDGPLTEPRVVRVRQCPSRAESADAQSGRQSFRPRRCAQCRDPRLHGANQAMRRPDGRAF